MQNNDSNVLWDLIFGIKVYDMKGMRGVFQGFSTPLKVS